MRRVVRFTVGPRAFQRIALAALAALTLIVFTGAAVRLSGSGLGCPDWPKCHGGVVAPADVHSWIEYGNRIFSALVGLIAVGAGVAAWRRRPFRRDLALIGTLLPLGIAGQGALGALTVIYELRPGFVMSHFWLSMLILIAAFALAWRARYEPGERPRSDDVRTVWAARALLVWGTLVVFMGTAATAAGPHAGSGGTGEVIDRLEWLGSDTLDWTIHQHGRMGTALGILTAGVYLLLRRWKAPAELRRAVLQTGLLLVVQGIVGLTQYFEHLPAGLVWIHVALATLLWLSLLRIVAVAGRLAPDASLASARSRGAGSGARASAAPGAGG